jgi:enoyl-CoA hydratase/carnithine racemase/predicted thioesterase
MKHGLQVGQIGQLEWVVDPSMTITLGGDPRATIFSTPNMIMLMERAAREALRPFLEEAEESVGVEVQVEHLGAAPLGSVVHAVAKVTAVDERRVSFELQAFHEGQLIGRGTHRRAIISLPRFLERLPLANAARGTNASSSTTSSSPISRNEVISLPTIQVELDSPLAYVTLNRPQQLNAVNTQMTEDLERLVAWLKANPAEIRIVILRGEGKAFCAGDDVKELPTLSMDQARELSLRQARVYLGFEQLPQPIIAAIDGVALGGGCVAAYSCDFRIATHNARFGMPEILLGWPPGYGISQLTALVGKARALQLCLTGEAISAKTALEWGLVHELVPGSQLMLRVMALANRLLTMPAEALRATKTLIHADEGALPKVTHRADTEAYIRCLQLPEARDRIEAFIAKRSPATPNRGRR